MSNPNFPSGLDIRPLVADDDGRASVFDADAQEKAIQRFGIAGRIWEAAQLMVQYFNLSRSSDWELDPPCSIWDDNSPTIIELGSGTGFVGLKLAEILAKSSGVRNSTLVLTDLPDVCPLLEENLQIESEKWPISIKHETNTLDVRVAPLSWGDAEEARKVQDLLDLSFGSAQSSSADEMRNLSHIVCSDLVYFPHLLAPLLRSLLHLTSPPFTTPGRSGRTEVLISYKIRSLPKETTFWSAFGLWFTFAPVLARMNDSLELINTKDRLVQQDPKKAWQIFDTGAETAFLFVASRREESYEWTVPVNDAELLSGVGALGTMRSKGDDTFESLLLLQIDGDE